MVSVTRTCAAVLVVVVAAQVVAADPFLDPTRWYALGGQRNYGKASNYGGPYDGVGAGQPSFGLSVGGCGYGMINDPTVYPYRHAIAFDPSSPAIAGLPSFGCGSCWKITNTANWAAVITMVTDVCPGCSAKFGNPNHVDIHYDTWKLIADPSQISSNGGGVLNVVIERVHCDPQQDAKITIMDHQGTFSWLRLFPDKIAGYGTITGVTVTCPDTITFGGSKETTWSKISKPLKNSYGTVFEIAEVPLYRAGSSCYFTMTNEAGESMQSAPIQLGSMVGTGQRSAIGLGGNFGGSSGAGRKLLDAGRDSAVLNATASNGAEASRKLLRW